MEDESALMFICAVGGTYEFASYSFDENKGQISQKESGRADDASITRLFLL